MTAHRLMTLTVLLESGKFCKHKYGNICIKIYSSNCSQSCVYVKGCLLSVSWRVVQKSIVQSIRVKSCFVGTGKMHPFSSGLCLFIRNALPWLWKYGLVSFCARSISANRKWHWRDHTCDSETSHSESAPPTGRAPQDDWGVCARRLFMAKTVYNGQQWAKQSKPLFLPGSKHWLALNVLQYSSLDQNVWLDLVQHQWSTMKNLTKYRAVSMKLLGRILCFRKKAKRRTGFCM